MKFTFALSFVAGVAAASNPFAPKTANSAQAKYTASLLKNARRLADQADNSVDITGYAVKFEKCQSIKAYDDELAQDQDSDTVLGIKRFVIFRLCPDNACSTCNSNYGEYMVDLDTYLAATGEWATTNQEEMCNACADCAVEEDAAVDAGDADAAEGDAADGGRKLASVDCTTCAKTCADIATNEANGEIDATSFIQCKMIYDSEDDSKASYYGGPTCTSGSKIEIGVFTDEYCFVADESKKISDYVKLNSTLLKTVYSGTCISCADESADDGNNQANDMCESLYEGAAKCEVSHGMKSGFYDNDEYLNQENQETVVCDFIKSVSNGAYDSSGEISIYGGNTKAGRSSATSGGQKVTLTFFILGAVGLAAYAAMLHTKLTKGGKAGLANQGGAMA